MDFFLLQVNQRSSWNDYSVAHSLCVPEYSYGVKGHDKLMLIQTNFFCEAQMSVQFAAIKGCLSVRVIVGVFCQSVYYLQQIAPTGHQQQD